MPFEFMLITDKEDNLIHHDEGADDIKYSTSAFKDIKKLTVSEISIFAKQAKGVVKIMSNFSYIVMQGNLATVNSIIPNGGILKSELKIGDKIVQRYVVKHT